MTKIPFPLTLLVALLVCLLPIAPAQALVNRTFVSAAGSDSNNCANVATPCRHFAAAYAVTAPSGEIFVLDPANYGSLTITHAVSIEGHGWASIAPPNGGNAVTINASSGDNVSIHGVAIDGTGATGGTNGIVFNSGGSLIVTDCVVQNFTSGGSTATGNGIVIAPTSGAIEFIIANTTVASNAIGGIVYFPQSGSPSTKGVIDHVLATGNHYGIEIITAASGGGTVVAAISNTIANDNVLYGIQLDNSSFAPTPTVSIDNVSATGNGTGILANANLKVLLGRSVITVNGTGVANATTSNTFYTYKDNRISANTGTDITSPLNATVALQ
jgi:hypothetical protein